MKWFRIFEEGFVDGVLEDLRDLQTIKVWAFEAPLIGERVDESLISCWRSLFGAPDPKAWQHQGYKSIDTRDWLVTPELQPEHKPTPEERLALKEKKKRFEQTLTVSLDMRDFLPFQQAGVSREDRRAMLVL